MDLNFGVGDSQRKETNESQNKSTEKSHLRGTNDQAQIIIFWTNYPKTWLFGRESWKERMFSSKVDGFDYSCNEYTTGRL